MQLRSIPAKICQRNIQFFFAGVAVSALVLSFYFDILDVNHYLSTLGSQAGEKSNEIPSEEVIESGLKMEMKTVVLKVLPSKLPQINTVSSSSTSTTTVSTSTTFTTIPTTKTTTLTTSTTTPTVSKNPLPSSVAKPILVPNVKVQEVSCAALFSRDLTEFGKADKLQLLRPKVPIPDQQYVTMAQNCDSFKKDRKYITEPLSPEEAEFPLAFSVLIFKDIEQFERLLRAIYRPQNFYCIHIDSKSSSYVKDAAKSIAGCFENVFLASHSSDVQWGTWTVLEPELTCMTDLLKFKKWKYFINLTGQEFPLKTNLDLVRILKVYNGANNMEGTVKRRNMDRVEGKGPSPHSIVITKGSVHITATRAFIDFVINDPRAQEFANWLKDTGIPDETFFSSLNHSPDLNVPGAYKGEPETDTKNYLFITRFKNWGVYPFNYPCAGQRVRMVCIFSVGDLHLLAERPELFANKFYLDYHHFALDCMEELHYNRTLNQVNGIDDGHLDLNFYKGLDFVQNHVMPPADVI